MKYDWKYHGKIEKHQDSQLELELDDLALGCVVALFTTQEPGNKEGTRGNKLADSNNTEKGSRQLGVVVLQTTGPTAATVEKKEREKKDK